MKFLLTFLLLASCSTAEKKQKAWDKWNGKPKGDISRSPYFRRLPVTKSQDEKGVETWIFKEKTPFQTSAYCQSLGGCMGMPIYNCDSIFRIKDDIILDLKQKGSCPDIDK